MAVTPHLKERDMKALVYTQPNEMQILDRPHPILADGEVILKIERFIF
jgi:threonine dehydrogenase-like Zn-dependent dehydrogenase